MTACMRGPCTITFISVECKGDGPCSAPCTTSITGQAARNYVNQFDEYHPSEGPSPQSRSTN